MADEISVQCSMFVRDTDTNGVLLLDERFLRNFRVSLAGVGGPSPGDLIVPTTGKLIYFDQLTTPGMCWVQNNGLASGGTFTDEYVELGIFDPQSTPAPGVFYPMLRIKPGQGFVLPLSPNLGEQYAGSGTGTTTSENYLYAKAFRSAQRLYIGAFET